MVAQACSHSPREAYRSRLLWAWGQPRTQKETLPQEKEEIRGAISMRKLWEFLTHEKAIRFLKPSFPKSQNTVRQASWQLCVSTETASEDMQDYFSSFRDGKPSTEKPQGEHPVLGNECRPDLSRNRTTPDSLCRTVSSRGVSTHAPSPERTAQSAPESWVPFLQ